MMPSGAGLAQMKANKNENKEGAGPNKAPGVPESYSANKDKPFCNGTNSSWCQEMPTNDHEE